MFGGFAAIGILVAVGGGVLVGETRLLSWTTVIGWRPVGRVTAGVLVHHNGGGGMETAGRVDRIGSGGDGDGVRWVWAADGEVR